MNAHIALAWIDDSPPQSGIAELGAVSEVTQAMIVWGLPDGATTWPFIADINPWG